MPLESPRGSAEDRFWFYSEAIARTFEERFFDIALWNPDPQCYRMGWFTESVPNLDLYFGRSLPDEEIEKLGHDVRDVEISWMVSSGISEWELAGLRAMERTGVFEGFAIEEETEGEIVFRSVFFKIPYPYTSGKIRKALLNFAVELEKAGFRNNGQLDFNWIEAVDMNDFAFAEHDASMQLARIEEEEHVHGDRIDLTQAKEAIGKILKMPK